ncbi:hypothetical protein ACTOVP_06660 [Arcanobacterium canis]
MNFFAPVNSLLSLPRQWWRSCALAVFSVVLLLMLAISPALAQPPTPPTPSTPHSTSPSANTPPSANQSSASTDQHVLVLLTSGLSWQYINSTDTPHLAQWADAGTMFNMIPPDVREWGCPEDVSLALSTGTLLSKTSINHDAGCAIQRMFDGAPLPLWQDADFDAIIGALGSAHKIGALSQVLQEHHIDSRAIGAQAGALLVTPNGLAPEGFASERVSNKVLSSRIADATRTFSLTVADITGANFSADPERSRISPLKLPTLTKTDLQPPTDFPILIPTDYYRDISARKSAERAEAVISKVPTGTKVYFLSLQTLAATEVFQPGFVSFGPGTPQSDAGVLGGRGLGWSPQVRQHGNVHYSSIVPSILADFGIDALAAKPAPKSASSSTDSTTSAQTTQTDAHSPTLDDLIRVGKSVDPLTSLRASAMTTLATNTRGEVRADELASSARKASVIVPVRGAFVSALTQYTITYILIATAILVAIVRPKLSEKHGLRRIVCFIQTALSLRGVRILLALAGLWISAIPAASLITTWVWPWWMSGSPRHALFVGTYLAASVLAGFALVSVRWHSRGPLVIIGAVTAAVILADVATGSRNIADSPIGFNTLVGARFYGLGNEAFSFESTGLLLALGGFLCWASSTRRGMRRSVAPSWALTLCALIGTVGIMIGVWPTLGADFGGAIALMPALVILLLLASGKTIRLRIVAFLSVGGLALSMGIALLDWLRPTERHTHLGNFVQAIIDGDAWDIVWRKLSVNLQLLVSLSHRWIVLAGVIFLFAVVWPWLTAHYAKKLDTALLSTPDGTALSRRSTLAVLIRQPLGYTLTSVLACTVIAFAVNDSGIVLPGSTFQVLMPALAATIFLSFSTRTR